MTVRIIQGDALEELAKLGERSCHMALTSPPYWGLRAYLPSDHADKSREIGQEKRLDCLGWAWGENCGECYICKLRNVFAGVWRVLRDDGTLWINQGDSYHNGDKGGYLTEERSSQSARQQSNLANDFVGAANRQPQPGLKPKDICAQPWRLALALQADGWYWRDEIIWHKKSCMPSSQRDRCTRSHEVVLMFSKAERYFYDIEAIKEPCESGDWKTPDGRDTSQGEGGHGSFHKNGREKGSKAYSFKRETKEGDVPGQAEKQHREGREDVFYNQTRTKRSVWSLGPEPFKESHFATFPSKLVEPMILAGTSAKGVCSSCGAPWVRQMVSEFVPQQDVSAAKGVRGSGDQKPLDASDGRDGFPRGTTTTTTTGWRASCGCEAGEPVPATILDCFGGAGTTGLVADRLHRNAILIELNATYAAMAEKRIHADAPLFAEVGT